MHQYIVGQETAAGRVKAITQNDLQWQAAQLVKAKLAQLGDSAKVESDLLNAMLDGTGPHGIKILTAAEAEIQNRIKEFLDGPARLSQVERAQFEHTLRGRIMGGHASGDESGKTIFLTAAAHQNYEFLTQEKRAPLIEAKQVEQIAETIEHELAAALGKTHTANVQAQLKRNEDLRRSICISGEKEQTVVEDQTVCGFVALRRRQTCGGLSSIGILQNRNHEDIDRI